MADMTSGKEEDMTMLPMRGKRVEPLPPTLEDEMTRKVNEVAEEVKQYAPAVHPDRVSATTRIMKDAINKVVEDTAVGINARVSELRAKVADIEKGAEVFNEAMRKAADALNKQIEVAMAQYEDLTKKMQESPFSALPKISGVGEKAGEE